MLCFVTCTGRKVNSSDEQRQEEKEENSLMAPPAFIGGALSFKGEKSTKTKKKNRKSKHKIVDQKLKNEIIALPADDDSLTEAERKALRYKEERAKKELESVAKKSHRERVEEFNEKLGNLTELNDIPRVSVLSWVGSIKPRFQFNSMLFIINSFVCRSVPQETGKYDVLSETFLSVHRQPQSISSITIYWFLSISRTRFAYKIDLMIDLIMYI